MRLNRVYIPTKIQMKLYFSLSFLFHVEKFKKRKLACVQPPQGGGDAFTQAKELTERTRHSKFVFRTVATVSKNI